MLWQARGLCSSGGRKRRSVGHVGNVEWTMWDREANVERSRDASHGADHMEGHGGRPHGKVRWPCL